MKNPWTRQIVSCHTQPYVAGLKGMSLLGVAAFSTAWRWSSSLEEGRPPRTTSHHLKCSSTVWKWPSYQMFPQFLQPKAESDYRSQGLPRNMRELTLDPSSHVLLEPFALPRYFRSWSRRHESRRISARSGLLFIEELHHAEYLRIDSLANRLWVGMSGSGSGSLNVHRRPSALSFRICCAWSRSLYNMSGSTNRA